MVLVVLNDGEIDIFLNFACSCRAHGLEAALRKVVVFAGSKELGACDMCLQSSLSPSCARCRGALHCVCIGLTNGCFCSLYLCSPVLQ